GVGAARCRLPAGAGRTGGASQSSRFRAADRTPHHHATDSGRASGERHGDCDFWRCPIVARRERQRLLATESSARGFSRGGDRGAFVRRQWRTVVWGTTERQLAACLRRPVSTLVGYPLGIWCHRGRILHRSRIGSSSLVGATAGGAGTDG